MRKADFERLKQYFEATAKTLYDCYKKPSARKVAVYEALVRRCALSGGYGFRVLSHTVSYFTAAWLNKCANGREVLTVVFPTKTIEIYVEGDF